METTFNILLVIVLELGCRIHYCFIVNTVQIILLITVLKLSCRILCCLLLQMLFKILAKILNCSCQGRQQITHQLYYRTVVQY
jgi:hypothetical protein